MARARFNHSLDCWMRGGMYHKRATRQSHALYRGCVLDGVSTLCNYLVKQEFPTVGAQLRSGDCAGEVRKARERFLLSIAVALVVSLPTFGAVADVDVAGVKLGMSPEEVRAVLAARKLTGSKEFKHTIAYPDPVTHQYQSIQGTEYLYAIVGWIGSFAPTDNWQTIDVVFSPQPGHERVVEVSRVVNYSSGDAVALQTLRTQLVGKYGRPWYDNPLGNIRWVYPPGAGGSVVPNTCHVLSWDFSAVIPSTYGTPDHPQLNIPQPGGTVFKFAPQLWSREAQCERAQASAFYRSLNGNAPEADRVITQFTVSVLDTDLARDAAAEVAGRIRDAISGVNRGALDKARRQSAPDL